MAKNTKKKNRKLRRQIRKTIGALFMASAIVVAAVPVQDVEAEPKENATKIALQHTQATDEMKSAELKIYQSLVPSANDSWIDKGEEDVVYTTGDGKFQFLYMRPNSTETNKYAVIVGYNSSSGDNSTLEIPSTLTAYKKYSDNVSSEGYCLVSKNGGYLYYEDKAQKKDPDTGVLYYYAYDVLDMTTTQLNPTRIEKKEVAWTGAGTNLYMDENGVKYYRQTEDTGREETVTNADGSTSTQKVYEEVRYELHPIMETVYSPCYYDKRDEWENISDEELLYRDSGGNYVKAGTDNKYWKIVADVAYIGNDVIKSDNNGGWTVVPNTEADNAGYPSSGNGAFKNAGNVQHLIIGGNIKGIGDYAFSGCANLQSVTLGDNLETIGNGAFADCIRLTECIIPVNASIQAIGKDAFYNCASLKSFTAPIRLLAFGDSCFEKCTSLESIELQGGDGGAVALTHLGDHVFRDCQSLASIELPVNYEESSLDVDMFEGCTSLQYIKVNNENVDFGTPHKENPTKYPNCQGDESASSWDAFKATVPESFYFEGPKVSSIHDKATEQSIAFKYLNQDLYEKIEYEHDSVKDKNDPDGKSAKVTYQVNSNNELVNFFIEDGHKPDNVTIPEKIGPYGISYIGAGSFSDNCDLVKITIPAAVTEIGAGAFKGCHNLETVIFTDASTIQDIGSDAFKTQEITCQCTLKEDIENTPENEGPGLTFVGAMMNDAGADTIPFIYAMNGASSINNADQEKIWITCHSGWPTNLEVQYKYDPISNTGEAQLVGYPRYEMIMKPADAKAWVAELPYVTPENQEAYENMVLNATKYYQATEEGKKEMDQPTENEMAIVNSTLNVVVPNSVDCIEPGLFSGFTYDEDGMAEAVTGTTPDKYIQTVVLNGVNEVEPYTFKNCVALREAAMIGPNYIGDYAFEGPSEDEITADSDLTDGMTLQTVTLGTNLTDTGKRPFKGCEGLTNITCLDSDFVYSNGILYRNTGSGLEIVECLEARGLTGGIGSYSVGPEELAGVTAMKEEAFEDCDGVGKIDISGTTIEVIPERAFAATDDLNTVVFGDTVTNIEAESFRDSAIRLLTIPGNQVFIAQDAFATQAYMDSNKTNKDVQQTIIFECVEGLYADRYAKEDEYWYINPEYGKVFLTHTVYFFDYPNYPDTSVKEVYYKVDVKDGEDAVPPIDPPVHDGYLFNRWTDYTKVTKDLEVYPIFGDNIYKVEFRDTDGTLLGEVQFIEEGKSATPPADPTKEGYTFTGWSQSWHDVKEDLVIIATYSDNSSDASRHTVTFYGADGTVHSKQSVNHGEAAVTPQSPVKSGYKFLGWIPSDYSNVQGDMTIIANFEKIVDDDEDDKDKDKDGEDDDDKNSDSSKKKKYTVSVSGGSGSGSYAAGDIVAINAYYRGTGQSFDKWTTSTAGVGFANSEASSTTFTMPAANVAVTATYKVGGGSTATTTGGATTTTGGTQGTASSGTVNGSSVQITKPGISNTGLAGATVSGATDNFIVKVTEDQNATNAVVTALQTRFGDISRIKYWPMDISLYDSTGRTKIADTSGISVNLTLPIPDELVQYAGNNKVAAVSGGVLEDLNTRFTTVDGVPCVNFTATHFSPYVIYVDTANLSAGTIDATPKTGDGVHPKWFLSIGMACIALVLFFKRDKAVVPAKTV